MREAIFHFFTEEEPVGQVRQTVVQRHMRNFRFGLPPLGDVLMGSHPTTPGHGAVYYCNRAPVGQFGNLLTGLSSLHRLYQAVGACFRIIEKCSALLSMREQIERGASRLRNLR